VSFVEGQGATGDPASLGVSAILLGQSQPQFMSVATRQANHLLLAVPRFFNGAISQREDVPELWADFVYMAPPFLAYYAKATNDESLAAEVVRQLGEYRQVLRANVSAPYEGLWEHIVGPQSPEHGLWATGNGWAAAGMTRVLGTINAWAGLPDQAALAATIAGYIKEILDGARGASRDDAGLLLNYMNDATWFGDASGTALLAAAAYRGAVLAPETFGSAYIEWADISRQAIVSSVSSTTGIIAPTVNPLAWGDRKPYTEGSPEGQSFAVLMYAAYRDCVCAGICQA
jgi:rhamnogalacturonyl hydrolase YesR